jgi:hypothetical protein
VLWRWRWTETTRHLPLRRRTSGIAFGRAFSTAQSPRPRQSGWSDLTSPRPGACARWRPQRWPTTRSGTTLVRFGRTTPRSASRGWSDTATAMRRLGWSTACSLQPRPLSGACRSFSAVWPVTRLRSRCRTRWRAAHRPGVLRHPCCCCGRCSSLNQMSRPGWWASHRSCHRPKS